MIKVAVQFSLCIFCMKRINEISPALEFSFYMAHHHIFADGDDWKYITCITSHIIFLWYCKKSTYECHYNWCEQQPKENPDMSRGRITRCWVWKYEMFNIYLCLIIITIFLKDDAKTSKRIHYFCTRDRRNIG